MQTCFAEKIRERHGSWESMTWYGRVWPCQPLSTPQSTLQLVAPRCFGSEVESPLSKWIFSLEEAQQQVALWEIPTYLPDFVERMLLMNSLALLSSSFGSGSLAIKPWFYHLLQVWLSSSCRANTIPILGFFWQALFLQSGTLSVDFVSRKVRHKN